MRIVKRTVKISVPFQLLPLRNNRKISCLSYFIQFCDHYSVFTAECQTVVTVSFSVVLKLLFMLYFFTVDLWFKIF